MNEQVISVSYNGKTFPIKDYMKQQITEIPGGIVLTTESGIKYKFIIPENPFDSHLQCEFEFTLGKHHCSYNNTEMIICFENDKDRIPFMVGLGYKDIVHVYDDTAFVIQQYLDFQFDKNDELQSFIEQHDLQKILLKANELLKTVKLFEQPYFNLNHIKNYIETGSFFRTPEEKMAFEQQLLQKIKAREERLNRYADIQESLARLKPQLSELGTASNNIIQKDISENFGPDFFRIDER